MAKRVTTNDPVLPQYDHWFGKVRPFPSSKLEGEYAVMLCAPPNLIYLPGHISKQRLLADAKLLGEEVSVYSPPPPDLCAAWNNGVKASRWWLNDGGQKDMPQYWQRVDSAVRDALMAMLGVTMEELWH